MFDFQRNMFGVAPSILVLIASAAGAPAVAFDDPRPDADATTRPAFGTTAGAVKSVGTKPTDDVVCFSGNNRPSSEGDFLFKAELLTIGGYRCIHRADVIHIVWI